MNRGSSWLPRLTASRPASFMASIFFFPQTSTDKPRPRQLHCACVPRKRAVVTDGGSLMRSRARNTLGIVACGVCMDFSIAERRFRPGLKGVRLFNSGDGVDFERY